jgi:hypothetical protein
LVLSYSLARFCRELRGLKSLFCAQLRGTAPEPHQCNLYLRCFYSHCLHRYFQISNRIQALAAPVNRSEEHQTTAGWKVQPLWIEYAKGLAVAWWILTLPSFGTWVNGYASARDAFSQCKNLCTSWLSTLTRAGRLSKHLDLSLQIIIGLAGANLNRAYATQNLFCPSSISFSFIYRMLFLLRNSVTSLLWSHVLFGALWIEMLKSEPFGVPINLSC